MVKAAVVGVLLNEGRPMSIAQVRAAVLDVRPIELLVGELTPKRLSDALRYYSSRGIVRRVGRGVYVAVPTGLSRTTAWRYRRWERRFDQRLDEWNAARATLGMRAVTWSSDAVGAQVVAPDPGPDVRPPRSA